MRATDQPITPWPRWQLLATLGLIAAAAATLLAGSLLALAGATVPAPRRPAEQPASVPAEVRDRIAAAPMVSVPPEAARGGVPVAEPVGTFSVPPATAVGPAGVETGFPRTPAGAVAQLAAIEVRVLEAMSLPVAREVHQGWVLPGGPASAEWELTGNVQAFLVAAGLEGDARDDTTLVTAIPAGAQVKGSDGPDWVVACVLLDVRASIVADARIGWGHCERMAWTGERWMIGPGRPPAPAPSTWPGSQAAADAGWLAWQEPAR